MRKITSLTANVGIALALLLGSAAFVMWQSMRHDNASDSASSALEGNIQKLTKEIEAHPRYVPTYLAASSAYLQKIRETADVSYYATIDDLLNRAFAIDPANADIFATRASVANGRHHFKEGLSLIEKAILLNPRVAAYYGIRADSEIELGQYDKAESSLQKMIDAKPNYSAYSRIAYLRELHGDIEGAKEMLRLAIESGSSYPENIAWAEVELGLLNLRKDISAAKGDFNTALTIKPNYAPALLSLGKAAFAEGNVPEAQKYFSEAFKERPLAQYAIDQGDIFTHQGDDTHAAQEYALARAAFESSIASGTDVDLEYSLFLADHGDAKAALEKAMRAHLARPSVYGADAYAWALYKNDRVKEAQSMSIEALRIGENDPLITYHSAVIQEASGNVSRAKELFTKTAQLNPHFSILFSKTLQNNITQ